MTYFTFSVTNNGTDAGHIIAADFSIASVFSWLELDHGSNLLEQIHEYGTLVKLWHSICGKLSSFTATGNVLEG